MFEPTILDHVPLWAFFLATLGVTLFAAECGYRMGRRRAAKGPTENREAVGAVVGATLALLSFLLAFTFGLATSRYDSRREALQEEVNAIGATYLRSSYLPDEPHGNKVRALLRRYVNVRLEVARSHASAADALRESNIVHQELWKSAVEAGRNLDNPGAPNSDVLALFVDSLNQLISAQARRIDAVFRGRVPAALWACLIFFSMVAVFSMGYYIGIQGTPRPIVGIGMVLCFTVTMFLIADLDRPLEGFIRVNHQAFIDLRGTMTEQVP